MASSNLLRRPAFVLVVGLCGIAAVTTLLGRLASGPQTQTKPVALADVDGTVAYPAFSADGNRLAYAQRGMSKDDAFHLYVRRLPKGSVTQLTTGDANEISPAWSPDGARIAFLRVNDGQAQLTLMASNGGAETKLAEFPAADNGQPFPALAWSRDGRTLAAVSGGEKQPAAIIFISATDGSIRRGTTPPEGSDGDWCPAYSPDGSKLGFLRGASPDSEDVYEAEANGANPQRLTFNQQSIRGLTWTPNGDLIYAGPKMGRFGLWRLTPGASAREVIGTGDESRYPAVPARVNRLSYVDSPTATTVWRAPMIPSDNKPGRAEERPELGRPILRSDGRERLASYSPDGKRIANISDQTGFDEIWISDADGGNRVQITNFAAAPERTELSQPAWSPDGQWLLFDERTRGATSVWKTRAAPGSKPVRVVAQGGSANWSHDGKAIYYSARGQIWKAAADGSNPVQLTERGGDGRAVESPDGKFVYYRLRRASVWRVPVNGGTAENAFGTDGPIIGDIFMGKNGIYYLTFHRGVGALAIYYYDFASKDSSEAAAIRSSNFGYTPVFSISPDLKYVLFARVDQSRNNLMFVDNFR